MMRWDGRFHFYFSMDQWINGRMEWDTFTLSSLIPTNKHFNYGFCSCRLAYKDYLFPSLPFLFLGLLSLRINNYAVSRPNPSLYLSSA